MQEKTTNFIQANSPDGGFLQSEEWRKFQESVGRKTFNISENNFHANIIEHELPVVGKYFYIPGGPIMEVQSSKFKVQSFISEITNLAKKENIGWIRFDANYFSQGSTLGIPKVEPWEIKKAPHDMQPKEIFLIDITKPEEQLLTEMKPKTRYNIKVAQKHKVNVIPAQAGIQLAKYIEEFLRLVKITAKRDKITPHPDEYYRKMFETIPAENIKLYVAEYGSKVIAANIMIFYGKVATYLHGASDNEHRNTMAPYLLQWQAMLDAKEAGCEKYDFGGVKTQPHPSPLLSKERETSFSLIRRRIEDEVNSWAGITRFKTGFSTVTKPVEFPGSYDIILNPFRYNLYRILQRLKALF